MATTGWRRTGDTARQRQDIELSTATQSNSRIYRLIEHSDGDLCPCPRCLKGLPSKIFFESMIRSATIHLLGLISMLTVGWTPIVYYSSTFWATSWGAVVGTLFIVACVLGQATAVVEKLWGPSAPLVNLTTRLYHRCSSLALASFLERASRSLQYPQLSLPSLDRRGPELFVSLHTAYMTDWRSHGRAGGAFCNLFPVFTATATQASVILGMIVNMVSDRRLQTFLSMD
jgi:hypothetical protein